MGSRNETCLKTDLYLPLHNLSSQTYRKVSKVVSKLVVLRGAYFRRVPTLDLLLSASAKFLTLAVFQHLLKIPESKRPKKVSAPSKVSPLL